jgi:hypothetical protein
MFGTRTVAPVGSCSSEIMDMNVSPSWWSAPTYQPIRDPLCESAFPDRWMSSGVKINDHRFHRSTTPFNSFFGGYKEDLVQELVFSQLLLWRILSSGILAAYYAESQPTFRRKMSPQSSRSTNKQAACYLPWAGFLLSLFFDSENEGDMFLRNVNLISMDNAALYFRRWNSSRKILCVTAKWTHLRTWSVALSMRPQSLVVKTLFIPLCFRCETGKSVYLKAYSHVHTFLIKIGLFVVFKWS